MRILQRWSQQPQTPWKVLTLKQWLMRWKFYLGTKIRLMVSMVEMQQVPGHVPASMVKFLRWESNRCWRRGTKCAEVKKPCSKMDNISPLPHFYIQSFSDWLLAIEQATDYFSPCRPYHMHPSSFCSIFGIWLHLHTVNKVGGLAPNLEGYFSILWPCSNLLCVFADQHNQQLWHTVNN